MDLIGMLVGVVGLVIGIVTTYYYMKAKTDGAVEKATSASERERLLMEERLRVKETDIQRLNDDLTAMQKELTLISAEKTALTADAATFNERITNLERERSDLVQAKNEQTVKIESLNRELKSVSEQLGTATANLEQTDKRVRERDETILTLNDKVSDKETLIASLTQEKSDLETDIGVLRTSIDEEKKAAEERLQVYKNAEKSMIDAFKALSQDALGKNAELFTQQAKQALSAILEQTKGDIKVTKQEFEKLVKPIEESLEKFEKSAQAMETNRVKDTTSLVTQIKGFEDARKILETKTAELVSALKADPRKWGSWGEMQLRRVIQIAGMEKYCDFEEQSVIKADGKASRPDVIVKLPNNKSIVIDSKAVLDAYTSSFQAESEKDRMDLLKNHAKNIETHIKDLSKRNYEGVVKGSVDFVVMFVPGESVLASALDISPDLLDIGAEKNVLLATPVTLIGLLRAVAYGWREEELAKNARTISEESSKLYERICIFLEHFMGVRKGLENAVEYYNKAVGSLEKNVLPQGRKLKELSAGSHRELGEPEEINDRLRSLNAQEAKDDIR